MSFSSALICVNLRYLRLSKSRFAGRSAPFGSIQAWRWPRRTFLDWGVIAETKKAGVYLLGKQVQPNNAEQLAWLAEAVLISRGENQMPFPQLCRHPILFPVRLDTFNASVLRVNPRLRVERQNLNEEFVSVQQRTELES